MDNHIYGLTKGQVSPTSSSGMVTVTTPYGSPDTGSVNPLSYVLTYGGTYVAQAFSGNPKQLANIIKQAIEHKGFSFVNIISPCLTFNKIDTFDFYKDSMVELPDDHDSGDLVQALDKSINPPPGKFYTGIFHKVNKPTLLENLQAINKKASGGKEFDLEKIMDRYRP
jgi:2-oxoglutarate ferredoxin oxidoreductase subunit beta